MIDGQYKIGNLVFGRGTMYQISSVELGGYSVAAGDSKVSQTDEIRFGKDYLEPGTITFTLAALDNEILEGIVSMPGNEGATGPVVRARDLVEALSKEWRADEVRLNWGYLKPLIYCREGEIRRAYGRPRKFAPGLRSNKGGWIDVVCDYQQVDTLFYSDVEKSVVAPIGGSAHIVRSGGTANSWFRALVTGPITNPQIQVGSLFTAKVTTVLAAGKVMEINSYPWERRVVNSDNVNLSANLMSPYLDQMRIPPGSDSVVTLTGTGTTGATNAVCYWREAYGSF